MGKRTNFKKIERDFYPTKDPDAVKPLLRHLPEGFTYVEPCCGDGSLVKLLGVKNCVGAYDIVPQGFGVKRDLFEIKQCHADMFITNPPWTWAVLKEIIPHLSGIAPTWLLLNADLAHNKRMGVFMKKCVKIVSVGRVSWMNNGKKGFENAAWYLFDEQHKGKTEFVGR